jgi:hypothetical protein
MEHTNLFQIGGSEIKRSLSSSRGSAIVLLFYDLIELIETHLIIITFIILQ